MAQDDYYYEIQLTNKQLVFYFMAGALGLILSFLAGIMVGRGVDGSPEVQAATRPAFEDKIITEEPPVAAKSTPAAEDLSYSKILESDTPKDAALEVKPAATAKPDRPKPERAAAVAGSRPPVPVNTLPPTSVRRPVESSRPAAVADPPASSGSFTIQVGAFKDKGTADSIAEKLKKKGFSAYVVTQAESSLFSVRVGSFATRADADKIKTRLRVEEKYDPYIVPL